MPKQNTLFPRGQMVWWQPEQPRHLVKSEPTFGGVPISNTDENGIQNHFNRTPIPFRDYNKLFPRK